MSMNGTLSRVTQEQAQAMRADPALADDLLSPVDPTPPPQPGLLARLLGKKAAPLRQRALAWIGANRQYELDHQWQILHFLLTGRAEGGGFPAGFICDGGEEVGEDRGYGRPRLFTSAQARQIAAHLDGIGEQELLRRYQPERIEAEGIYWSTPESEDERREDALGLVQTMGELARFIDETARDECALVVEIW